MVFLRIVYSDVQFGHPRYTIRTGSLKHPFLKSTFRQPQKISSGRTAHHHEFLFPRLKSKSTWSQATFNLFNLGKTFLLTHYFGGKSFKSLKNSSVTETANQTESYLDQKASVHSDDGNSRFKREISQQNPSIFYQNSSVLTPNMLIHSINSSQFPPSSSQNQSNIWDFESIQPFLPSSKDKDNFLSAIKTGSLKSTPNSLTAFEEISHYKTSKYYALRSRQYDRPVKFLMKCFFKFNYRLDVRVRCWPIIYKFSSF